MKEKLKKYFEDNRTEIEKYTIEILSDLVKEKSVNVAKVNLAEHPYLTIPGEESKVAKIVAREMDKLGIKYEMHELVKGRANLIATYGKGSGPSLLVGAHTDIVPAGDGWDTDPYVPYVKDGMIYGRGVMDDKGPLVSIMVCLKAFKELGIELNGTFLLGAIASEEHHEFGEEDPGLDYLIKNKLITPDFAIIPDIGENMKMIDIAEKGRFTVNVRSYGKQAHGSTPDRGINAISMMSDLIQKLKTFKMKFKAHPFLKEPTLNLGTINAGSAANIVPGQCDIVLDIRYLPGQSAEGIVKELQELTKGIEGRFEFVLGEASLPHEVDPNNILVDAIQNNCNDILGYKPEPFGMGGGTFAKGFNLAGIKAVGFGPGDDSAFHVANESVELKQLVDFAHLIGSVSIDLLN